MAILIRADSPHTLSSVIHRQGNPVFDNTAMGTGGQLLRRIHGNLSKRCERRVAARKGQWPHLCPATSSSGLTIDSHGTGVARLDFFRSPHPPRFQFFPAPVLWERKPDCGSARFHERTGERKEEEEKRRMTIDVDEDRTKFSVAGCYEIARTCNGPWENWTNRTVTSDGTATSGKLPRLSKCMRVRAR